MMGELRKISLLHAVYLWFAAQRPTGEMNFILDSVDIQHRLYELRLWLGMLPRPASWVEKLMHKVITYRLEKEICTIEALQDMHVVLIGMNIKPEIALKGGEAGEEALLQQ